MLLHSERPALTAQRQSFLPTSRRAYSFHSSYFVFFCLFPFFLLLEMFLGMISFPGKESQRPQDTGHSASSVSPHLVLGLREARPCTSGLRFPSLEALRCWVCKGNCAPAPAPRARVEGAGLGEAFFTGRCFPCRCLCPTECARARLCLRSLNACQERCCEAVLKL